MEIEQLRRVRRINAGDNMLHNPDVPGRRCPPVCSPQELDALLVTPVVENHLHNGGVRRADGDHAFCLEGSAPKTVFAGRRPLTIAMFKPVGGSNAQQPHILALAEGQHPVIEQVGGHQGILAVVQFDESDLGVGIDERLLIDTSARWTI